MTNDIPDFQSFFRPLLEILANGEVRQVRELYEAVADYFALSPAARKEMVPSKKQLTYQNRTSWAKTYLKKAGLVEQPARGQVKITPAGKKVLQETEGRLDVKLLTGLSEEFAQFHSVDEGTEVVGGVKGAVSTISPKQPEDTPDIRLDRLHKSIEKALATELLGYPRRWHRRGDQPGSPGSGQNLHTGQTLG